jgi:biotin carboxylase
MNQFVLAIIGAGEGALPIITKAKEMGVKVVAYGRNDSLAKDQVDVFVEENNFDIQFIADSCHELNVNGIMPSSELSTEVAARVAHTAGLLGNDLEHGFGGKNKYFMRTKVANLVSIKQPKFQLYEEGVDVAFPVVVKSVDACGKRGVSIAYNKEDLKQAVPQARENSSDGSALVEEYLKGGQEYSIECLSSGKGKHYVIQYTEKESSGPPHFVEIAHHQPAILSDETKARIDKAAWDILEVLGLNCGMAHLEIKIIDNEIYFIEVGARGGGDHISDILTPLSTGFDYYRAAIECHLGIYQPVAITNKAYTGIYFHSKQNERLKPLFELAKTAKWCIKNTVVKEEFDEATGNVGASNSGYIIYCSDHRITI